MWPEVVIKLMHQQLWLTLHGENHPMLPGSVGSGETFHGLSKASETKLST
jgi:hypothetical protein